MQIETPAASVAVIIRTKDRPLLLSRALEDVLAQTFAQWVAVVVNDAGKPEAVDTVVANYADQLGDRVVVVHNAVSKGREAAVNRGLEAGTSTFVTVHDDDDTWDPTFLAETVGYLERTSAAAVAVRTEVIYERIDGDEIQEVGREMFAADRHTVSLAQTVVASYTGTNSLLFRRSVLDVVGTYDESLPVLADWDFHLRLLAAFDVGFIGGKPLAFWHHRPQSTGPDGNSVFVDAGDHQRYADIVRNRHFTAEVRERGGLGSALFLTGLAERHRAEAAAQVSAVVEHFDAKVDSSSDERTQVLAALRELNQNLVSQSNRLVAQFEDLRERVQVIEDVIRSNAPRARLNRYARTLAVMARSAGRSARS